MEALKLTKDEFVDWFDGINSTIVKRYKFDKYYDIMKIMNMEDKVVFEDGDDIQPTLYWGGRKEGTVLLSDLSKFENVVQVLGADVRYKLEFDFSEGANLFCIATKLSPT